MPFSKPHPNGLLNEIGFFSLIDESQATFARSAFELWLNAELIKGDDISIEPPNDTVVV
jgi:hypothetical protein